MVFAHLPGIPNHHPTPDPDPSIAVFLEGSKPLCLVNHCISQRRYQKRAMSRRGTEQRQEWGGPSNLEAFWYIWPFLAGKEGGSRWGLEQS